MNTENFAENFEDLRIWQKARVQTVDVYRDFGIGTPAERDFGFRDQAQRAGISVMNNIAEGFERRTPKDFAKFLDYAKGSCGELRSMLYVAEDLGYLNPEVAISQRTRAKGLSQGIEALAKKVRARI